MFWNKKVFEKKDLTTAFNRCRRRAKGQKAAVIFFDLDKMKLVNDRFSHLMGDKVIGRYLEILENNIRSEDYMVRFGGDEVIVFMPHTEESAVDRKIKTIQDLCLNDLVFKNLIKKGMSVTAGALIVENMQEYSIDIIIDKASKLTKRAKYTLEHSLVRDILHMDDELEVTYEQVRRNDEIGVAMRSLYEFMVNELTRHTSHDAAYIDICCKEVWREYDSDVINKYSFQFLKKKILKKYEDSTKLNERKAA